ncbi:MAG: Uma2 family endonuclease [Moorea sp. SIO2I5]|nr:Uma2 family endonuclease [Moorena sp. SIO2I5]
MTVATTPVETSPIVLRMPPALAMDDDQLRSPSDKLQTLQNKMTEYIDNGAKLGWLIDRKHRRVYVYRPGVETEQLDNPATVSGEPVLPGFVLKLSKIW